MARNAKLRLVSDAKAAWRKEKEEAKKQAEEASAHGMAIGNGDEIAGRIGVTA